MKSNFYLRFNDLSTYSIVGISKVLSVAIFMILGICTGSAQWFVAPSGSGGGTSWEDAAGSIYDVMLGASYVSGETIYVKEGTYTGVTLDDGNQFSTMPDGKDVVIEGGYDSALTGTSTCGYDPVANQTIFDTQPRMFRLAGGDNDGNLTLRGLRFENNSSGPNSEFGSIVTLRNMDDGTFLFEDLYITNQSGYPLVGSFHLFNGTENSNVTFNRVIAEGNTNLTLSVRNGEGGNTISINDSYFSNNATGADNAGVIFVRGQDADPNTLNVDNSTFCSNSATGAGVMDLQDGTSATIANSKFYGNNAGNNGGAINAIDGATVTSTGNVYYDNIADRGTINVEDGKLFSTNDIFISNEARQQGGAITVNGTTTADEGTEDIKIIGGKFYQNSAGLDGGAIDISGTQATDTYIENSEFLSNSADNGGAIKAIADLKIYSSRFESNIADTKTDAGTGGAIKIANASLWLNGSWFKNNRALDKGGAINFDDNGGGPVYSVGYRQHINASVFFGNSSGNSNNVIPDGEGGALYFTNVRNGINITGSDFYNNSTFSSGSANGGGAIKVDGVGWPINSDDIYNFDNNKFGGNTRNGDATRRNNQGGSDIKMYFAQVRDISNSVMQLASQGEYDGDFSWAGGNTFGGATPVDPGTLSPPSANTTCPTQTPMTVFSSNPPTEASLATSCDATSANIAVAVNDLAPVDTDYEYTWTKPDMTTETGTATSASQLNLSNITETGRYILTFTDKQGCEVKDTIDVTAINCITLPVELLDFRAKFDNNNVLLTWATASEIDNSHFMIERSLDGEVFETIGKVNGQGTSSEKNDYSFVDDDPYTFISYYRLKQVDFDGAFEYSDPISVEGTSSAIKVYPNPASDFINVDYPAEQEASVYIYDVFGKLISQKHVGRIPLNDYRSGTYLLKIVDRNGKAVDSKIITVQR